jgi:hypothetical protein
MPVTFSQFISGFGFEQTGWSALACRDALTALEVWTAGGAGPDIYVGWGGDIGHQPPTVGEGCILVTGSGVVAKIGPQRNYRSVFVSRNGVTPWGVGGAGFGLDAGREGAFRGPTSTVDSQWSEVAVVDPPGKLAGFKSWTWEDVKAVFGSSPPDAIVLDMEPSVGAAHIGAMYGKRRDQRMRYLTENGLSDEEVHRLIALVVDWLGDAEMSRLYSLSVRFAQEQRGVAELLAAWLDNRSLQRLAELLHGTEFTDHGLAVAYALCHALTLVRSAHRIESLSSQPVPLVGAGEDPQ